MQLKKIFVLSFFIQILFAFHSTPFPQVNVSYSQLQNFSKNASAEFNQALFSLQLLIIRNHTNVYNPEPLIKAVQYFQKTKEIEIFSRNFLRQLQGSPSSNEGKLIMKECERIRKLCKKTRSKIMEAIRRVFRVLDRESGICRDELQQIQNRTLSITSPSLNDTQIRNILSLQNSIIVCGTKHFIINIMNLMEKAHSYNPQTLEVLGQNEIKETIHAISQGLTLKFKQILNITQSERKKTFSVRAKNRLLRKKYSFHQQTQNYFEQIYEIVMKIERKLRIYNIQDFKIKSEPIQFTAMNFLIFIDKGIPYLKKLDLRYEKDHEKSASPQPFKIKKEKKKMPVAFSDNISEYKKNQIQKVKQQFYQTVKLVNDILTGLLLALG